MTAYWVWLLVVWLVVAPLVGIACGRAFLRRERQEDES